VRCHLRPFSVEPTSEFVADSALEGDGFELLVPRQESPGFPTHPGWYARIRTGFQVAIKPACAASPRESLAFCFRPAGRRERAARRSAPLVPLLSSRHGVLGQKPLVKAGNTSTFPANPQAQTGQNEFAVLQ